MGGKQQESQEMGKGMHEQIEFAVLVQKLRVACEISGTLFISTILDYGLWVTCMGYGQGRLHTSSYMFTYIHVPHIT